MCGIVGYVGKKSTAEILLNGLSKLEYRGYDSAGIALNLPSGMKVFKANGKLHNLKNVMTENIAAGSGIGHIRWATHGGASEVNAHPHSCNCGSLVLVHNGIIENFQELKDELTGCGCVFKSQTDTEVIAHLVAREFEKVKDLKTAVINSIKCLKGAFALCVMHNDVQDTIVVAKRNAPLVLGVGNGENYIASDIPAIIEYTKSAIYLDDNQIGVVSADEIKIYDASGNLLTSKVENLPFEPQALSKMGYKHYMLKEIHEQSDVIRNILAASPELQLKKFDRIQIIACGTSLHAALVGKYVIEDLAGIPVDVEASSEFIYRSTIINENTLVIGISQSGETADTITAIKQVKEKGAKVLIVTNRPDSTMARLADNLFPIEAGIEVSVAATKSYMAQLIAMYLLGILLAKDAEKAAVIKAELSQLPAKVEMILNNSTAIAEIARKYSNFKNFIFIARGINYPSALEGALKLKEISYINATGYSAGELKHGPIAMLDESMPVLAFLSEGIVYDKVLSNCQEAKARQAKLIAVTNVENSTHQGLFDDIIQIPHVSDMLSPTLNAVVLQLLAYYIAEFLGKDVDQPRNLAKSVTVE